MCIRNATDSPEKRLGEAANLTAGMARPRPTACPNRGGRAKAWEKGLISSMEEIA